MIPYSEAQNLILSNTLTLPIEKVLLSEAYGKALAQDIFADRNYPPFNRSAMDGFAIAFNDDLQEKYKIQGSLFAGSEWDKEFDALSAIKIMTGAAVPKGYNAVIKIEECIIEGDFVKFETQNIKKWQNIAKEGEDIQKGVKVELPNTLISSKHISVLASLGYAEIEVFTPPSVTVITTGDEIKSVGEPVNHFQIRDSNTHVINSMLKQYNVNDISMVKVKDDKSSINGAIEKGLESDILILTGGVSMGDADFVPEALSQNGVNKVFHKTKIKPGKPIWFGKKGQGKVVFGLPGNPYSVQVTMRMFVIPFILKSLNLNDTTYNAQLSSDVKKRVGLTHFSPVQLNENLMVEPSKFNGSGDIKATLSSNGLILLDEGQENFTEGSIVKYIPW